jgi:hypothetical protein
MAQIPTYGSSPPFLASVSAISRQSRKKHKKIIKIKEPSPTPLPTGPFQFTGFGSP